MYGKDKKKKSKVQKLNYGSGKKGVMKMKDGGCVAGAANRRRRMQEMVNKEIRGNNYGKKSSKKSS